MHLISENDILDRFQPETLFIYIMDFPTFVLIQKDQRLRFNWIGEIVFLGKRLKRFWEFILLLSDFLLEKSSTEKIQGPWRLSAQANGTM